MPIDEHPKEIGILITSIEKFVEKIIKKITLDTHANLVAQPAKGGTPVDTGWARANWQVVIGDAAQGVIGERPKERGDHLYPTSAIETQGAELAISYTLDKGKVFLSNNVPYINSLNGGHSQQAPPGFVQRAIAKAITEDLGLQEDKILGDTG